VAVTIDDSDDYDLINVSVDGVVRSCRSGAPGLSSDLLIELNTSLVYNGRFMSDAVWWLVATPSLHWHRTDRLLFSQEVTLALVSTSGWPAATRSRTEGPGRARVRRRCLRDALEVSGRLGLVMLAMVTCAGTLYALGPRIGFVSARAAGFFLVALILFPLLARLAEERHRRVSFVVWALVSAAVCFGVSRLELFFAY
jgi:hypothetical protein